MKRFIGLMLACLLCIAGWGQRYSKQPVFNDSIELDPTVKYGQLSNGLTYYIQRSPKPDGKVQMWFASKVGNHLETKDQYAFSHIVEHMFYQGSENFPSGIGKYLRSEGLERGGDYNAAGTQGGIYCRMTIDVGKPELLNQSYKILQDWVKWGGLLFKPDDIEIERGAVRGEHLMTGSDTVGARIYSKMFNKVYVSDLTELITTFKNESLVQFYKDWHRPNMQAVIIVGDIDIEQTQTQIKRTFGELSNPTTFKSYDSLINLLKPKVNSNNKVIIETSPQPNISIALSMKRPSNPLKRVNDYKTELIDRLIKEMLSDRLRKKFPSKRNLHFSSSSCFLFKGKYPGFDELQVKGNLPADSFDVRQSLDRLILEMERLKRYGFTKAELDFVKSKSKHGLLFRRNEKSSDLARIYVTHFLEGDAAPSAEFANKVKSELFDGITLSDVNSVLNSWKNEKYFNIIFLTPGKNKLTGISQNAILSSFRKAKRAKIKPIGNDFYTSNSKIWEMDDLKVIKNYKVENLDSINARRLTFSNGATVILKPMCMGMSGSPEIQFSAFSPGGYLKYKDGEYSTASIAGSLVRNSGLNSVTNEQLQQFFKDRGMKSPISPYIGDIEEGLMGTCDNSIECIEAMLQGAYQYFTNPQIDKNAIEGLVPFSNLNFKERVGSDDCNEQFERISKPSNESIKGLSVDSASSINIEKALDIFKERFSNAGDFTFLIVGDFKIDSIIDLVGKYLGNLPAKNNRREKLEDLQYTFPTPRVLISGDSSSAKKATITLKYIGESKQKSLTDFSLRLLGRAIEDALFRRLRDEMGGTYSVSAAALVVAGEYFVVNISFVCDVSDVNRMRASALEEIKKLKSVAIDISIFKEQEIRWSRALLELCQQWILRAKTLLLRSDDLNQIAEYERKIYLMTPDDLLNVALLCLNENDLWQHVCYE